MEKEEKGTKERKLVRARTHACVYDFFAKRDRNKESRFLERINKARERAL